MKAKFRGENDMDDLLKRAFSGDLPAGVEAGMRERIVRFRAGATRRAERPPEAAWTWLFRRSALAVLSILMLVAGILLQGTGSPSSLAESIAHIKARGSSSETDRRPDGTGVAANALSIPENRTAAVSPNQEATS